MTWGALAVAVAALSSPLVGAACANPAATERGFQKGMVFGLFAREEKAHSDRGLAELKDLGVNSVSIVVPWVTKDIRSLPMAPRSDMNPPPPPLTYAIRKAHELGMTVFLMPFLYVDDIKPGEWRGTIAPPDWQAWFTNYEAFILHYAEIAQREKVEYFSVGSELCSTESRHDDWGPLLSKVRAVYKGRVTYSANWDHKDGLSFAKELDVLGMNTYFKLADAPGATVEDLVAAWRPIKADVDAWRAKLGKRLLITEVGYPSRPGGAVNPWDYDAVGEPDMEEQSRCYRAFVQVWGGEQALEGVYFYIWWGDGGSRDIGYTPRGKPAENVLRQWYGGASGPR